MVCERVRWSATPPVRELFAAEGLCQKGGKSFPPWCFEKGENDFKKLSFQKSFPVRGNQGPKKVCFSKKLPRKGEPGAQKGLFFKKVAP